MVGKKRARSLKAKRERRDSILDAAVRILVAAGPADLRMEDVAAEAGVAKGTLYLYFRHRSDLLTAVADRALLGWMGRVDGAMRADLRVRDVGPVAAAFIRPIVEDPAILARLGLQASVRPERGPGTDVESEAAFLLAGRRLGDLLAVRLPATSPQDGLRMILVIRAVLVGLGSLPAVLQSLPVPGDGDTRLDPTAELARLLPAILQSYGRATETMRPMTDAP